MSVLASIFVILCLASAINYFKTRKQRALITNIKGPFTIPLMGSMQKLALLTPHNFFKRSQVYTAQFGSLSRCWAFDRLFIPTSDYEFVEQLLSSTQHLNTGYKMLRPLLGAGVMTSDGEEWQRRRQLVCHIFHPTILEDFIEVFVEHSNGLVKDLRTVSDGITTFDISTFLSKTVLDVMIETTLGIDGCTEHKTTGTEYAEAMSKLTTLFTERFLRLDSTNNVIYSIMCPLQKRRQRRLISSINRINNTIIAEHRTYLRKNSKSNSDLNDTIHTIQMNPICSHTKRHITLLDILLESHIGADPLTNVEMCDELNTVLFQGNLLTSSALSFALVMIARHPSVQQQILEELRRVWPNSEDRNYTLEQLNQLQYLECVIKETLRLYPAQPIIGRELVEQFPYSHSRVGDGIIPIGAEIYICLFDMLRNPDQFKDPLVFQPERHQSSFNSLLSFSMGPRNCLAQKYAMLLMKTVIAEVLTAYEVLPFGNEVQLEIKIVLKSKNGFQVGLKPRISQ